MSFNLFTTIMGMLPGIDELNARFDKLIGHKHDKTDFNGGAITAGSIDNIPAGNITSTDQQAVNAELDSRGYGDNLFLNPFFQIWQRGTSFVIAAGASVYTADRKLVINNTNQSVTVTQFQYANKQYSLKIAATSTAPTTGTVDVIERSDQHELSREIGVGCFQGKYATVQFEVDGADPTFLFRQFFGTGGSPSASVDTAVTLTKTSLGGTANKYVGSVLIPSISGKVIGTTVNTDYLQSTLSIPLRSTAVNVMAMQLQYGKINSNIRQRFNELAVCQRYCQVLTMPWWSFFAASGTDYSSPMLLPVTMRAVPAATILTQPNKVNITSYSINGISPNGINQYVVTTAAMITAVGTVTPAVIKLDAEL